MRMRWVYLIILLFGFFCLSELACTPDRKRSKQREIDSREALLNKDSLSISKKIKAKLATKETEESTEEESTQTVSENDVFVRTIVDKKHIVKGQTIDVKFRLYTKVDVKSITSTKWPSFDASDIEAKDVIQDSIRHLKKEMYEGRAYHVVDLKTTKLKPQKAGTFIIEPVTIDIVLNVPTGQTVPTFLGDHPIMEDLKKILKSEKVVINVIDKK